MLQGLLHRGGGHLFLLPAPEGAAGGGEDQAAYLSPVPAALKALEDSGVLGIHRHDLRAIGVSSLHHQFPGAHQGLLVGQGDALALTDGRQGGTQTHHTHHSGEHHVRLLQAGRLNEAVHPCPHPDAGIGQPHTQVGSSGGVHHHRQLRAELTALFLHPLHIPVGGKGSHSHATGGNHFQ